MPQAFVMRFPDGTTEQYDQVIEKMDLGGRAPESAHYHWVAQTEDGLLVVDVWETPEAFQAFAEEKIQPLSEEVGLAPPVIESYAVHNTLS